MDASDEVRSARLMQRPATREGSGPLSRPVGKSRSGTLPDSGCRSAGRPRSTPGLGHADTQGWRSLLGV